jgi:signal peptidase I
MEKWFKGLLWIAGVLAAIAGILRLTVMNVWTLPDDPVLGAAAAPTLAAGDTVVILTRGTPTFGELVRCTDPEDPTKFVVGRIGGVEGDVVETQGATLKVNGKNYTGESACPKPRFTVPHPSSGSDVTLSCDVVTMGGGWHYRGSNPKPFHSTATRTDVGPGMIFLVSDDREYHDDSRDFGTLPRDSCKERPVFRLWGKSGWSDDVHRLSYLR